ncbi:hypothetical protein JCM4814A_14520 [Streptomyces phaeofaciens JCM 4814]|uniref:Uncharacterized protein n=1 Tax=Streptomyces phaeofaciens TaxID=68254 RepID=A0A918LZ66_9ACTN|nr:hypothetical protein [Streptomyces phaeofaciens]GGT75052.1 hypothetical protein GCM10010226_61430 [Streptomyces phaeofaciens]
MPGPPSARSGRPSTPFVRALTAAVLATAALVIAANTGPAPATETSPATPAVQQAEGR